MKYNHMFDVAFSIDTDEPNPDKVTLQELIKGLLKRIPDLYNDELEAFGHCDTIEINKESY